MPTYAYACTECDHRFEAVQSFSDDSLTVCPECEGRLRKVFNAVGIVFKGGGFYRTDSRSGSSVTSGSATNGSGSSGSVGEVVELVGEVLGLVRLLVVVHSPLEARGVVHTLELTTADAVPRRLASSACRVRPARCPA